MEELRLSLLIFGGCAILGILAHGLWSIRKNSKAKEQQSQPSNEWQEPQMNEPLVDESDKLTMEPHWHNDAVELAADLTDTAVADEQDIVEFDPIASQDPVADDHFDELGIGQVRVVSSSSSEPLSACGDNEEDSHNQEALAEPKRYASVVTQPKPEVAYGRDKRSTSSKNAEGQSATAEVIPEPPEFLLKQDQPEPAADAQPEQIKPVSSAQPQDGSLASALESHNSAATVQVKDKESLAESVKKRGQPSQTVTQQKTRLEPSLREDQINIDFAETSPRIDVEAQPVQPKQEKLVSEPQQEVLVLNVKAADDQPIPGAALLPMLLTLGFKFGEQDIFHRHVNSNGTGPVLFSLANMFKPGVFDIDNMENFTTQGVSLFMILPIEGDPHQVFNMMHNAARKISDEFAAKVLDGRRSVLTKQSLQQYVEKIREFERQRMLQR